MVFFMKMLFAIELLKHTNNQYGIVQLQNFRTRVTIFAASFAFRIYRQAPATSAITLVEQPFESLLLALFFGAFFELFLLLDHLANNI